MNDPPEIRKIDVGALGPGMAVLTRHCNAWWAAPDEDRNRNYWPKHGLNARRHVFGLALASNTFSRTLEVWAYLLVPAHEDPLFDEGCWFIVDYSREVWADLTERRRIP